MVFFNLNITGIYENCVTKNGNKFKKKKSALKTFYSMAIISRRIKSLLKIKLKYSF